MVPEEIGLEQRADLSRRNHHRQPGGEDHRALADRDPIPAAAPASTSVSRRSPIMTVCSFGTPRSSIARLIIVADGFPTTTGATSVLVCSAARIEPQPGTRPSSVGRVRSGFVATNLAPP